MNLFGMWNSYKAKLQLPHYKKVDDITRIKLFDKGVNNKNSGGTIIK